jgi:hypothetical protein
MNAAPVMPLLIEPPAEPLPLVPAVEPAPAPEPDADPAPDPDPVPALEPLPEPVALVFAFVSMN